VIRPAVPADVSAVLELWAAERSAAASTPDTEEAVLRVVESGALLVAEEDSRIVGTLIAAWDGWRGNLYRLAVRGEQRRRGVGQALVEAGEGRLRGLGARRITALVGSDDKDDGVLAFWRAVGYSHDRQIARFVRNLE
jgi:ribosomal protein S18 acetylase RimI-like enzyme